MVRLLASGRLDGEMKADLEEVITKSCCGEIAGIWESVDDGMMAMADP